MIRLNFINLSRIFGLILILSSCTSQKTNNVNKFVPRVGMEKSVVIQLLGDPDFYYADSHGSSEIINGVSVPAPYKGHFIEILAYDPLSKESREQPLPGDYRLSLTFINGTLQRWGRRSN
jgi:hypothetical protein